MLRPFLPTLNCRPYGQSLELNVIPNIEMKGLAPVAEGAWLATVLVRVPETLGELKVSQVSEVRVRFACSRDETVGTLLERAYAEAIRALELGAETLRVTSAESALADGWKRLHTDDDVLSSEEIGRQIAERFNLQPKGSL